MFFATPWEGNCLSLDKQRYLWQSHQSLSTIGRETMKDQSTELYHREEVQRFLSRLGELSPPILWTLCM
jgi:hypothetical protein